MAMNPLPPKSLRSAAAAALDTALRGVMAPGIVHIAPINTMGCFFLKHLTKCNFVPMAGSLWVPVGDGMVGLQASLDQIEDHQYYVWSECETEDGETIIVDFGARYWPAWAAEQGVNWGGKPLPYIWQTKASLPAETAVYTAHPEVTETVRHSINAAVSEYDGNGPVATWEAVINEALETVANRMQRDEAAWDYLSRAGVVTPDEPDAS